MLYSINWPNILGNMYIVFIYFPVYDVINFEINLTFWSSRFPTWPKKSGQKCKDLVNEKSF